MWTAPQWFVPTIILWHFDAGSGRRPPPHFRRQFYDIAKSGNTLIASEVLTRLGELYAMENEIRVADLMNAASSGKRARGPSLTR